MIVVEIVIVINFIILRMRYRCLFDRLLRLGRYLGLVGVVRLGRRRLRLGGLLWVRGWLWWVLVLVDRVGVFLAFTRVFSSIFLFVMCFCR